MRPIVKRSLPFIAAYSRHIPLLGIVILALAAGARADEPLGPLEKLSIEWVKTRQETVRAEKEWASQQDLLQSMVKALEERATLLEDKLAQLKAKTSKDRSEVESMQATNRAYAEQLKTVETALRAFDEKLALLRPHLPPRLSAALELPYRSLANPELPPSERMQLTTTVLNRCAQFNRTISTGEEIMALDGETNSRLLQTVYCGLSHGYALDRSTGKTWFGSPTTKGWQWEQSTSAAKAISALSASFNEKAEPEFIAVPARAGRDLTATPSK